MTDLDYPSWKRPYQDALLEFDPSKLQEKVLEAENAIMRRLQALPKKGQSEPERTGLNDALHGLRILQIEKLNYPPVPEKYLKGQS